MTTSGSEMEQHMSSSPFPESSAVAAVPAVAILPRALTGGIGPRQALMVVAGSSGTVVPCALPGGRMHQAVVVVAMPTSSTGHRDVSVCARLHPHERVRLLDNRAEGSVRTWIVMLDEAKRAGSTHAGHVIVKRTVEHAKQEWYASTEEEEQLQEEQQVDNVAQRGLQDRRDDEKQDGDAERNRIDLGRNSPVQWVTRWQLWDRCTTIARDPVGW